MENWRGTIVPLDWARDTWQWGIIVFSQRTVGQMNPNIFLFQNKYYFSLFLGGSRNLVQFLSSNRNYYKIQFIFCFFVTYKLLPRISQFFTRGFAQGCYLECRPMNLIGKTKNKFCRDFPLWASLQLSSESFVESSFLVGVWIDNIPFNWDLQNRCKNCLAHTLKHRTKRPNWINLCFFPSRK